MGVQSPIRMDHVKIRHSVADAPLNVDACEAKLFRFRLKRCGQYVLKCVLCLAFLNGAAVAQDSRYPASPVQKIRSVRSTNAAVDDKLDPSAIPFSSFASPEARRRFETLMAIRFPPELKEKLGRAGQMTADERRALFLEIHAWDKENVSGPRRDELRKAYKVDITPQRLAGVNTEVFTPVSGILPQNVDRVLINLHGGGFGAGWGTLSQIESIPIAAVARIKVISIDYREAPEFQFPAATEDVLSVYRQLLMTYKPSNIGIYGCSAGATLTAQVAAQIIADKKLPLPGAIGMFCGTGEMWSKGDSANFWALLAGAPLASAEEGPEKNEYFRGLNPNNPLMLPMRFPEQLRAFPPSLLISSTRDFAMSSIVDGHRKLINAGVDADLHIWEGVTHAFLYDAELPESQEAYDVIARFFSEKLGHWYSREVQSFVKQDLKSPAPRCAVLFTGSSSIKYWDSLGADMAPAIVLNRGFGGSTIGDINATFDQVITPYWPKAIFIYAGENELAVSARTPAQVLAEFKSFMALKAARLGDVPVYYISIKPSKWRAADLALQRQTNQLIERLAAERRDLHYVDVANPMLDHGRMRDIYNEDDLHLSQEGYRIWAAKLRPLVLRETEAPTKCRTGQGS